MIINLDEVTFKAFITVTYPSGSCTVSNGSKSYTHSGGGTYTFTVNTKGEWTIEAEDGTLTAVETVTIVSKNQNPTVDLKYVLFDNGDKCEEATGGWTTYASGAYNRAASVSSTLYVYVHFIYEYIKTAGTAYCRTKNPVPINGDALEVTVSEMSCTARIAGTYHGCEVRVSKNADLSSPAASYTTTKTGAQTITLPLTNLSGEYYVGIYAYLDRGGNDSVTMRVSKMQII